MAKIYRATVPNAFCYGMNQPLSKGMKVFSPNNHFGIVRQNASTLTVFDESIKINKKNIPNLKAPLFGKVKDLFLYFYPYGLSGSFSKTDYVFELNDGRKVKMSFKGKYNISIENPRKVFELNRYMHAYTPNEDGSLARPSHLTDAIIEYLSTENGLPHAGMKPDADWYNRGVNARGLPGSVVKRALRCLLALEEMFENCGYKVKDHDFHITSFEPLD